MPETLETPGFAEKFSKPEALGVGAMTDYLSVGADEMFGSLDIGLYREWLDDAAEVPLAASPYLARASVATEYAWALGKQGGDPAHIRRLLARADSDYMVVLHTCPEKSPTTGQIAYTGRASIPVFQEVLLTQYASGQKQNGVLLLADGAGLALASYNMTGDKTAIPFLNAATAHLLLSYMYVKNDNLAVLPSAMRNWAGTSRGGNWHMFLHDIAGNLTLPVHVDNTSPYGHLYIPPHILQGNTFPMTHGFGTLHALLEQLKVHCPEQQMLVKPSGWPGDVRTNHLKKIQDKVGSFLEPQISLIGAMPPAPDMPDEKLADWYDNLSASKDPAHALYFDFLERAISVHEIKLASDELDVNGVMRLALMHAESALSPASNADPAMVRGSFDRAQDLFALSAEVLTTDDPPHLLYEAALSAATLELRQALYEEDEDMAGKSAAYLQTLAVIASRALEDHNVLRQSGFTQEAGQLARYLHLVTAMLAVADEDHTPSLAIPRQRSPEDGYDIELWLRGEYRYTRCSFKARVAPTEDKDSLLRATLTFPYKMLGNNPKDGTFAALEALLAQRGVLVVKKPDTKALAKARRTARQLVEASKPY